MNCTRLAALRPARQRDIPTLARLYHQSWLRTYRGLLPDAQLDAMDQAGAERRWHLYLQMEDRAIFVAEEGAALCGFAACKPDPEEPGALLLDSIHVSHTHGGRGIGGALIGRAAWLARERGFSRMTVHVVLGNHRAEALYRHLGASPLGDFIDPEDGAPSRGLVWEDLSPLIPPTNCFRKRGAPV